MTLFTAPTTDGFRLKRPAHPGSFIKTEIIDGLDLTITKAAEILAVPRPALSALVNQHARLSPDMAVRLKKAFGVSMETLMRMQTSFDIAEAQARAKHIKVKPYTPTKRVA